MATIKLNEMDIKTFCSPMNNEEPKKVPDYKCDKCMDRGYILVRRSCPELYGHDKPFPEFKVNCPYCQSKNENEIQERLKYIGVPDRFRGKTLSDFKWDLYGKNLTKLESVINSFVTEYEKWEKACLGLYIHSAIKGAGKTFLASVIGNELIYRYIKRVYFVSCSRLIDIKQSDPEKIEKYSKCEVLILDDLGQKKTGESWIEDILFQIIDSRYQKGLTTIITSNINPKELKLDDRIVDRINTITQRIPLPEVCIRNDETLNDRREFFKTLNLNGKKDPGNQGNEESEKTKESEDKKE